MPRPPFFQLGQIEFDLSHLAGFVEQTLTNHSPAGVSVYCSFSHHCFTIVSTDVNCDYPHEDEHRNFDEERYQTSIRLPGLVRQSVRNAQRTMISVSADKNGAEKYLIVEDRASGQNYHVYFDITRSTLPYADLKLTVSSAYLKPDSAPKRTLKLGFAFDRALGRVPRRNWKKRKKK